MKAVSDLTDWQLWAVRYVLASGIFAACVWIVVLFGAVAGALATLIAVASIFYSHATLAVEIRKAEAQRIVAEAEALARKAAR